MTTVKLQYLDPSVARAYDRERFAGFVGRSFDRLEKRVLRRLLRMAQEGGARSALDIPCGTGRITETLLQQRFRVTGGDVSPAMIDVARERCKRFGHHVSWRQLDLDSLDVKDGSFDLVTCVRLFHHLESGARTRVLRELARVSRRFVIINVSYSSPIYRLRRRVKRALRQGVSAQSSTPAEIEREATAAGLKLVKRAFVWPIVSEDLLLLFSTRD